MPRNCKSAGASARLILVRIMTLTSKKMKHMIAIQRSVHKLSEAGKEFRPIYFRPGIREEETWQFADGDHRIVVSSEADELQTILKGSNGRNSIESIVRRDGLSAADAERRLAIINDLKKLGVLVDAREIAIQLHETTNNPPTHSRALNNKDVLNMTLNDTYVPREGSQEFEIEPIQSLIGGISSRRESCRNFSPLPIEDEKLMACLQNAYSQTDRPIPSAGGLYPLRLYTIQKVDTSTMPKGLYHYNHISRKMVLINNQIDGPELSFVFGSDSLLHRAPTIVVVAADLMRQNAKYANRGYRYTLLEAGHAAQNMHLTAHELGLATLEFGGFRDDDLAEVFDMPDGEKPLVTVALGYQSPDNHPQDVMYDPDSLKGPNGPIEWSHVDFDSETAKLLKFYRAVAKFKKPNTAYGDDENLFATGTAASPLLAEAKAVAEGYERYMAGQVRYDVIAAAVDLNRPWLSPDEVRPISDEQLSQIPYLERFDPLKPMEWIKASRINGEEVYVPIDLVFYPIGASDIGRPLVADVDSSGMAAHVDVRVAAEKALLELLERDALMRSWIFKQPPSKIDLNSLPVFYQKRAEFWCGLGKTYEVLDFGHDDVAIVGVVIRSEDGGYPFMVSGCSASVGSLEEALRKADHEAELGIAEYITAPQKAEKLRPDEVRSPADHANFYAYDDYRSEIEWLWSGPTKAYGDAISGRKNVLADYNPVVVRITRDDDPLQVVRAIAPELVPISFGLGREVYLHPAVKNPDYTPPRVPHFFA